MSRIVRFSKTGGPEVLEIENIEIPPPAAGEVRIKVKSIGLNRAEIMFRLGKYLEEPTFPSRLGYEASGIIEAIGPGVKGFSIGDIVSTIPSTSQGKYGVYGEVATIPAQFVIKYPPSLSFNEAASLWMQYMTAYGALIDIAHIKKNEYVAITAASSSVGLAAIQLCNLVGAIPIAITRKNNKKPHLLKAGSAHVIVTQEEDLAANLKKLTQDKGARVVFDPVGGNDVYALAEGMAQGGILFEYGALSQEPTPFPLITALFKSLTMRGYTLFEVISDPIKFATAKEFILNALSAEKLRPIIDRTFTLDQIVEAHHYMESNMQFGKIVVTV